MFTAERRATRRRAITIATFAVWLVVVSGCAAEEPADVQPARVPDTVALGRFPEPPSDDGRVLVAPTAPPDTTTTTTQPAPDPITGPLGDEVAGNRVLVIGDTVLQSTAPRAGGTMCDVLEAFGWQGEIAAEVGRFVEFGAAVVDARVVPGEPDWDAAAVMLGNHFDGDVAKFAAELDRLVASLSPRPMLLYTIVEDDAVDDELNEIIREIPETYPNVVIVDWAAIVADEPEAVVADTPSGLSEEGRARLALFTAAALGEPPVTEGAGCVPPLFTDDSAIVL